MNPELFEKIKNQSLEIKSLVEQGVKEGVKERIEHRNQLLQNWFEQINSLIDITHEQQQFLETLLAQEKQLVQHLEQEQQKLSAHQQGQKKLNQYQQILKQ